MTLTHYEASQINWGLIMKGDKNVSMYTSTDFAYPFSEMLDFVKTHEDWTKEDLYSHFAPSELDAALSAVSSLNGSSKSVDWVTILREQSKIFEISDDLEKAGKAGKKGKLPDLLPYIVKMRDFAKGNRMGLRDAREVDWKSAVGLQPSGWSTIDRTIGGIAESGLIVIGAPTKTGKSFFTAKMASEFLNYYKDRRVAIFPLELREERYLNRSFKMYPELMKPYEEGRIFVTHRSRRAEEIATDIEGMGDCGLVIVDGLRQMVKGAIDTSKVSAIWGELADIGVMANVPIAITVQPNRENKFVSKSKFLDMYAIEWSGDAENYAEQLWMLQYVQHAIDFDDNRFPVYDNTFYIMSWLQREGWKVQNGPGAVVLRGEDMVRNRDGQRVLWSEKPYENLLWTVGSARVVGEQPSRRKKQRDDN